MRYYAVKVVSRTKWIRMRRLCFVIDILRWPRSLKIPSKCVMSFVCSAKLIELMHNDFCCCHLCNITLFTKFEQLRLKSIFIEIVIIDDVC